MPHKTLKSYTIPKESVDAQKQFEVSQKQFEDLLSFYQKTYAVKLDEEEKQLKREIEQRKAREALEQLAIQAAAAKAQKSVTHPLYILAGSAAQADAFCKAYTVTSAQYVKDVDTFRGLSSRNLPFVVVGTFWTRRDAPLIWQQLQSYMDVPMNFAPVVTESKAPEPEAKPKEKRRGFKRLVL